MGCSQRGIDRAGLPSGEDIDHVDFSGGRLARSGQTRSPSSIPPALAGIDRDHPIARALPR